MTDHIDDLERDPVIDAAISLALAFAHLATKLEEIHDLTASGYPPGSADDIILRVHLLTKPITTTATRTKGGKYP